jgi:gluconokinase
MSYVFVIMGVSGSGKTTVGRSLAMRLNCPFYDGDDFHPPQNVAKMSSGMPLNDADRAPWLARLAALIETHLEEGETAVLACSALKKRYRDQLRVSDQVRFIYLAGSFDLIWQRMESRPDHYMKADMLHSQFDALEPPGANEADIIPIDQDVDAMVAQILQRHMKRPNDHL